MPSETEPVHVKVVVEGEEEHWSDRPSKTRSMRPVRVIVEDRGDEVLEPYYVKVVVKGDGKHKRRK